MHRFVVTVSALIGLCGTPAAGEPEPDRVPLVELAKALDGKDPTARQSAVEELARRGEAALPALCSAGPSTQWECSYHEKG